MSGCSPRDPAITADIVNLFHYLTGHSQGPQFQKLLVAPMNMRQRFLEMIEREVAHCEAGRTGHIIAKLNQVDDLEISSALVAASRAGVKIDLIVRGFCCLRAGVPGWTDNVRVRSIIGRFLEHSRIFYFSNGEEDPLAGEFYIGSADWMMRNLSQRVEAATPINGRPLRERLWEILQACLAGQPPGVGNAAGRNLPSAAGTGRMAKERLTRRHSGLVDGAHAPSRVRELRAT